ncbi:MAG: cytochrome c oxidase subunit II [Chloroflexota bacterium]
MTSKNLPLNPPQSGASGLHINPYERGWLIVSGAILIGFLIAVTIASYALGIQTPSPEQRVDPNTVAKTGPFAAPGLRELAPGKYEVYLLAQVWRFAPAEITVPKGSTVTFYVTSMDVQHGFKLQGTNINLQIVPGQVSKLTHTFDTPGEFTFLCHEYCGAGHAAMAGKVIVTP